MLRFGRRAVGPRAFGGLGGVREDYRSFDWWASGRWRRGLRGQVGLRGAAWEWRCLMLEQQVRQVR